MRPSNAGFRMRARRRFRLFDTVRLRFSTVFTRSENRRYKSIAPARDRLDETWLFGIIAQRMADLPNRPIDTVVGIEADAFAPDALCNLFPRDEPRVLLQKQEQHLHGDPL